MGAAVRGMAEIALQYNSSYNELLLSFANNVNTPEIKISRPMPMRMMPPRICLLYTSLCPAQRRFSMASVYGKMRFVVNKDVINTRESEPDVYKRQIMSRLIEGEFLNYRNVIPADSRTRVTIDTKEFIETIERASLIITERLKNPLRISFTEGRVVVRCQTNLGRVVDEFNADCEGDEVEIGFNNRYLLDALRNARTEKVRMEISGPLSPVKVLPAEGNDFLYLVLPVRFKND